ncbi:hypothetical protein Tco_0120793 [Tanacetum coccineum]
MYDLRYNVPSIILYNRAFIRSFLAFCGSSGSLSSCKYSQMGVIQLSSSSCLTSTTSLCVIDLSCITSTRTSLSSLEKVIEANLLRASAFLFWSLLMCFIEWQGKLASNSFTFSSIKPASEPSEIEAPSVNNFYVLSGSGSFLLVSSSHSFINQFSQVIMEYLVNISKRRAFWSLNEDILKINDFDYQYADIFIRASHLKKVMADKGKKSSMETFTPNDKAGYYSGITSITVNGKNYYELKEKFLDDMHNNAFSGTNGKDASNKDETAKKFKIETDVFYYETPLCMAFNEFNYLLKVDPDLLTKDIMGFKPYEDYKNDWIYEWNENVPWVYDKTWFDNEIWKEPKPVKNTCKLFKYKTGCSKWPTYSWREYGELKDEALRNKAIMECLISDDESSNDCWKRWKSHEINYHKYNEGEYENETHNKGHELCGIKTREVPVCKTKRYKMIKYSFNDEEGYVVVKEDEYDDLPIISNEACRAYQEIFQTMDEGWKVTRTE